MSYTLPSYRFVATNTIRPREHGHTRTDADTPAPTYPNPHATARPRTPGPSETTTTALCWDFWLAYFFNFSNFCNVVDIKNKELSKKQKML